MFRCDGGALLLSAASHLLSRFFSPFCISVGPEMHICAGRERCAVGHVGQNAQNQILNVAIRLLIGADKLGHC